MERTGNDIINRARLVVICCAVLIVCGLIQVDIAHSSVGVTVLTNPAGLEYVVDRVRYTSDQTFQMEPGSYFWLKAPSPVNGSGGTYFFSTWSDGGAGEHVVTVPSSPMTYTATFATSGFSSANRLTDARCSHTATLLDNNKVLIVGGYEALNVNNPRLSSAEEYDSVSGSVAATGSLNNARSGHTATRLLNGTVLITGGYGYGYLKSAELYDPATRTFAVTGNMGTGRVFHTATLLRNGTVLITGGTGATGGLKSAELYDPATKTFSPVSDMIAGRYGQTATLLSNGTVLIVGGYDATGSVKSAEVYDPDQKTFTPTNGDMAEARFFHTATALPDDTVLIAGGTDAGSLKSAELYDPATGLFTPTGALSDARYDHTATPLPTGKVLITGGNSTGKHLFGAELYDPVTRTFTSTGSLSANRSDHTATLLPSGMVFVAGGTGGFYDSQLDSTELYAGPAQIKPVVVQTVPEGLEFIVDGITYSTIQTFQWVQGVSHTIATNASQSNAAGTYYFSRWSDGGPLTHTVRGTDSPSTYSALFDIRGFSSAGSMTVARERHTATLLPNGQVLIAGGYNYFNGTLPYLELYVPGSGNFSFIGSMGVVRSSHTGTLLPDGKVLLAGGGTSTAELIDPVALMRTSTGSMSTPRSQHTATLLVNGKVLITGGYDNSGNSNVTLKSAELYDPVTGTFSLTGSMTQARSAHSATLLTNGKVLIVGGDAYGANPSAELYDPATGEFSPTGAPSEARSYGHTATLLISDKVLITGGYSYPVGNSAVSELYDPVAKTFTPTGSLVTARHIHTATLLPNGKVLIAGGAYGGGNGYLNNTELYDPAVGTFSEVGVLATGRQNHTATLLSDGNVLIAGGMGYGYYLNSAELFTDPTFKLLRVTSSNPGNTLPVTVTPVDLNGMADGATSFIRTYCTGAMVTLVAPLSSGGIPFSRWNGCTTTNGVQCLVTLSANRAVSAIYDTKSPLTVTIDGSGSGSVNSTPSGVLSCTYPPQAGTCWTLQPNGTEVKLLATPSVGSRFDGWGGSCSACADPSCLVNLDSGKNCTASFTVLPPVRIEGNPNDLYSLLQDAYNAAPTGATIQARAGSYTEKLLLNRPVQVTIKGGYDATYTRQSGESILQGGITIRQGSVRIDNLKISGP